MHLSWKLEVIQMAEVFSRVVLEGCKEAESRWELSDIPWKDQMKVFCWILTSLFKKFCPSPITIPKDVHCPPSSPDWSLSPEVSKHQAPVVTNSYWKHPTVLLQEKTTHEKFWTCSISLSQMLSWTTLSGGTLCQFFKLRVASQRWASLRQTENPPLPL